MSVINIRKYGVERYNVAVIHGGPGAPGSVAAVARELANAHGVLEPIQTQTSLEGQVQELHDVLVDHADGPVVLVGHSWGAWLAYLVAARYPALVRKLILVSSGAFEPHYVAQLSATRNSRLTPDERDEFGELLRGLHAPATPDKDRLLARLAALVSKTDDLEPIEIATDPQDRINVDGDMYGSVWTEAAELRKSGALLAYAQKIHCPVVAIHGDYDPSPAAGVREPLTRSLRSPFRFVTLERCGHSPWKERHAGEQFYAVLRSEI